MKYLFSLLFIIFAGVIFAQTPPASTPLFPNSIVSTDIDFIQASDPDAFMSLSYLGQFPKEMPDSESEELLDSETYVFKANFSDGNIVEIWCHSSFGSLVAAQEYAEKAAPRLGKLPEFMRAGLTHVVIHNGDAGAFSDWEFFVLYSNNMDIRIDNNDLEETIFHESVHASLDLIHASSIAWINAQDADVNFITDYAASLPGLEDLAETTIFAYTMLRYPGRLSADVENWVNTHIPYRLGYIRDNIFPEYIGIEDLSANRSMRTIEIFPNPAETQINFSVKNVEENTHLNIYAISGELVSSFKIVEGYNQLSIKQLSKGVYFVQLPRYGITKLIIN